MAKRLHRFPVSGLAALLVCVPLIPPQTAIAISRRIIPAEQAVNGVTLKVWPGYGLTLSFLSVQEVIQQAWLGDPSRISLTSDGQLCPPGGPQGCTGKGAQVLYLRQIRPIAFPDLTRSADGGTLLTVITEARGSRRLYQFQILPAPGVPDYTSVEVQQGGPSLSEFVRRPKPAAGAAIARRSVPPTPPIKSALPPPTADPVPQSIPPTPTAIPPATPGVTSIKTAPTPTAILSTPSPSGPAVSATAAFPGATPASSPAAPTPLTVSTAAPGATTPNAATGKESVDTALVPSSPPSSTPTAVTFNASTSGAAASSKLSFPGATSALPSAVALRTPQAIAIQDANATAMGLVVAKQKGQIHPHTSLWAKVQDAIYLLRRGSSRDQAARRSGVPMSVLNQLIQWGSDG